MKKRFLALVMAAVACFSLTSCSDYEDDVDYGDEEGIRGEENFSGDDSWAIYWYLCGSDLESFYKAGTIDLDEMMSVYLPENVKIVIETGGSSKWYNEEISADKIGRYVYDSNGFNQVDELPQANMGDPNTLTDFLKYCKENHPADKTMMIIWDHGGGTVSGAASDQNFGNDTLKLNEFHQAFDNVYDLSKENPPFELVGFDTCLMATIDTANTFSDISRYMVASEEWEPGGGWEYSLWLQKLAENPLMKGDELGKAICDGYIDGCKATGDFDMATISLIDLTKLSPLMSAYEEMGKEALSGAIDSTKFFTEFGRKATSSENYGGNTRDHGYSNMVDLGHLAKNCADILPQKSQAVIDGLKNCVVYMVNGKYHKNATGLSCYFSLNGDKEDFNGYKTEGSSQAFKYYFGYGLEGKLSPEGMDYVNQETGFGDEQLPEVPEIDNGAEYPIYLDEEGYVTLELKPEVVDMITTVQFQMAYVDEEDDFIAILGTDNDINDDWETGTFKDNFRGVWGSIDDNLVYMEVSYEDEKYTVYSVPLLINGEEYSLSVVYDYEDEDYHMVGARKEMDDSGMADKNVRKLRPGDVVTPIVYMASASGDDDFEVVYMDEFTITEESKFKETDLGDGIFIMTMIMTDSKNNIAYSDQIKYTISGDEFKVEILED